MSGALGALLLDTLRLSSDDGAAATLRGRWSEPRIVRDAAAIAAWAAWEGAELWLRARLIELEVDPPAPLAEPLRHAALRAAQGHLAIDAEGARVAALLQDAGIPVFLIKGLARRAVMPARLSSTRATSDVDILVPGSSVAQAWQTLRAAGYEPFAQPPGAAPRGEMWGDSRHHLRPLARPGGPAIEVHVSTSWELMPEAAWARLTAAPRAATWGGVAVQVPSSTEMAWHAYTHAKLRTPEAWRLWFWLDGATSLSQPGIDWDAFTARLHLPEAPPVQTGLRWLGAAAELAGVRLPPSLAAPRPYPLTRMLEWRLRAFRKFGRAMRVKLVDEATRMEAGLGFAPLAGNAWPLHLRRRAASVAARIAYAVWSAGRA